MLFKRLVDNLRSLSWKEWALIALVIVVFAAILHAFGLTIGPVVGYVMVLGLRRTKSQSSASGPRAFNALIRPRVRRVAS